MNSGAWKSRLGDRFNEELDRAALRRELARVRDELHRVRESASAIAPSAESEIEFTAFLKAAGSCSLTIDRISAGGSRRFAAPGGKRDIGITSGQSVTIDGWATDDRSREAAGGVLVQIDDSERIVAAYGIVRPDVAAALGMPKAVNSGFRAVVPAELLTVGRHRLSFLVMTSDRRQYFWHPDRVLVEVLP